MSRRRFPSASTIPISLNIPSLTCREGGFRRRLRCSCRRTPRSRRRRTRPSTPAPPRARQSGAATWRCRGCREGGEGVERVEGRRVQGMEGRRADEGERRKVDKRWVMGMEGGSVDGVRVGVPQRRRKTAVYRVKTEKPRLCYEVAEDRANGGQGGVDVRCGNGTDRSATWVRESEWAHRVQQQNPSTELGNGSFYLRTRARRLHRGGHRAIVDIGAGDPILHR